MEEERGEAVAHDEVLLSAIDDVRRQPSREGVPGRGRDVTEVLGEDLGAVYVRDGVGEELPRHVGVIDRATGEDAAEVETPLPTDGEGGDLGAVVDGRP